MENPRDSKGGQRRAKRYEPRNYVTVAFHRNNIPFTYGLISNISPTGACVVTTSPMPKDTEVFLKLSFYQHSELFETTARILWCREGSDREKQKHGFQGLVFHGVQFLELDDSQKTKLNNMLESSEFDLQYSSIASPPKGGEFEKLMSDLHDDLDRLGERFRKDIGEIE